MTSNINANQIRRECLTDTIFQAIATSEEAPTRQEIQLETNCSRGQTRRVLADLREHGRVRQIRDDDDARIVRYEIVAGGIDQ